MHSKYDRLVVFLIVGGSLLMLFGAISSLLSYIGYVNGPTKSSETVSAQQSNIVNTASSPAATEPTALSASEQLEKKLLDCLITAINEENREEDMYKELLKLQAGKPELDLFKTYISFMRLLCQGKVVGYKPVLAAETKAIQLEMLENSRSSLLILNKYKCFNLVSETKGEDEKQHEKMNLLVLAYVDGKLEINERLINDLLEPHYIARLYAESLSNGDRNLLANVLYTDLPDDESFRLNQADHYISYYKQHIDVNVDNMRIEEARPDMWLVSFPKKEGDASQPIVLEPESSASTQSQVTSETMQATAPTVKPTQTIATESVRATDQQATDQSAPAGKPMPVTEDELAVKPFNALHFSPKYFTRLQPKTNRHYVQLIRRNNNIVALDFLPLDNLASAWQVHNMSAEQRKLDLHETVRLADLKSIFPLDPQVKTLLYSEAIYSGLIKPQIAYEDKADKIYSHLLNFKGPDVESYSFVRRNHNEANPSLDLLIFTADRFRTNSPIQIGMTRTEILSQYPSIAMSDYQLLCGKTIMELHFDNQSKSGMNMRTASGKDRLTSILYYNVEWYQQDFDLANLHYVS